MDDHLRSAVDSYWRMVNYITVAQLYLRCNAGLRRPLRPEDVKPVVLGHWGVSPALNFVYAHLNLASRVLERGMGLVVGPAHAAAALLANLFVDGTLATEHEDLTADSFGLNNLVNAFGQGGRFQTEIGPMMPGVIYQGGELGHSLAVAQGAVLDCPGTVVVCFIGDGESETGGIAGAWHGGKFLHPSTCGAVLPILNLNGYKLGSPSVYAAMSEVEIRAQLEGCGYRPFFVGTHHDEMHRALLSCLALIDEYGGIGVDDGQAFRLPWPAIVLRTPKGWTGPIDSVGTVHSHKAPIRNAHSCAGDLHALEAWLRSYQPTECFDGRGLLASNVLDCLPLRSHRIGRYFMESHARCHKSLRLPDPEKYSLEPLRVSHVPTIGVASLLADILRQSKVVRDFRVFCPDEIESNRFEPLLRASSRTAVRFSPAGGGTPTGRVMEILNEPLCLGWLLGYLANGGRGVLVTYEAFAPILASVCLQHMRFFRQWRSAKWTDPISSLNIVLTSLCWRNCYTHQNPDFLGLPLAKGFDAYEVYTPYDGNAFLASMTRGLERQGMLNVYVVSKTELPVRRNLAQAVQDVEAGCVVLSSTEVQEPDVVLAVCGDFLLTEALAAVEMAQTRRPGIRIRVAYVTRLGALARSGNSVGQLSDLEFEGLFTKDRPVMFLFIGYPLHLKGLLFDRPAPTRFTVRGYLDIGLHGSSSLLSNLGLDRVSLAGALLEAAMGPKAGASSELCDGDQEC